MATFTRLEVYKSISDTGMVPVFYHADAEVCKGVLEACYKGGVRVFEFTNRGDFAHEVFKELVIHASKNFKDMILGAGTITDAATAALYIQNGANFIVSPFIKEDVAITCHRRKIAWLPGAATLTEVSRAEELGAEIVKVFPGNVLGPGFVKGLKGPMPWSTVMVTGGVEPEANNLQQWFDAGVSCVGMGSQLFPKSMLADKNWNALASKIGETMDMIRSIRSTSK